MSKYNELILNNLGYEIIYNGDGVQQIFDQKTGRYLARTSLSIRGNEQRIEYTSVEYGIGLNIYDSLKKIEYNDFDSVIDITACNAELDDHDEHVFDFQFNAGSLYFDLKRIRIVISYIKSDISGPFTISVIGNDNDEIVSFGHSDQSVPYSRKPESIKSANFTSENYYNMIKSFIFEYFERTAADNKDKINAGVEECMRIIAPAFHAIINYYIELNRLNRSINDCYLSISQMEDMLDASRSLLRAEWQKRSKLIDDQRGCQDGKRHK